MALNNLLMMLFCQAFEAQVALWQNRELGGNFMSLPLVKFGGFKKKSAIKKIEK